MANKSQSDPKFYKIINERIIIQDDWFDYLYRNNVVVEAWIKINLVSFLQSKNPNVPAIIDKLNPPLNRILTRPRNFWKNILKYNKNIKSIYTNEHIDLNNLSIDHFIPWSFVMHDMFWNLVPVSHSVNSSKGDRLPDLGKYFGNFAEQQYNAFTYSLKHGRKDFLEDYLFIRSIELNTNFPKNSFIDSLKNTITPLYQLALNQGFQIWTR